MLVHNNIGKKGITGRETGLDLLKFLCTFLVICIHCPFPSEAGEYFVTLCRVAVPVFFMITGFFYPLNSDAASDRRRIKKILRLVIGANLLYLCWNCLREIVVGEGLFQYLSSTITVKSILQFVCLNESPFHSHLWYLGAILYVLIIAVLAKRLKLTYVLYIVTPFLLLCDIVFGRYSLLFLHRDLSYVLLRNFLFVGTPYFYIGTMLRKKTPVIKKSLLVILVVLFSVTSMLERYALIRFDLLSQREHYISSTFLAITLFLLFRNINTDRKIGKIEQLMAKVGREYSAGVYIVHPIFLGILSAMASYLGIMNIYKFIAPIVIYVASIVFMAVVKDGFHYLHVNRKNRKEPLLRKS